MADQSKDISLSTEEWNEQRKKLGLRPLDEKKKEELVFYFISEFYSILLQAVFNRYWIIIISRSFFHQRNILHIVVKLWNYNQNCAHDNYNN